MLLPFMLCLMILLGPTIYVMLCCLPLCYVITMMLCYVITIYVMSNDAVTIYVIVIIDIMLLSLISLFPLIMTSPLVMKS